SRPPPPQAPVRRRRAVALGAAAALVLLAVLLLTRGRHDDAPSATKAQRPTGSAGAVHLPPGRPLTIAWGGDVTPGSAYGLPPEDGRTLLAAVRPQLRGADLAAVNLEGTFGIGGTPKCGFGVSPTCFAFQAPPANAAALSTAGVDFVNLANNHAWDYGADGMGQTVLALRARRIRFTGRPGEIAYVDRPHARVAFVGFAAYPWTSPIRDLPAAQALLRAAAAHANVVVALIHAGAEGRTQGHTPDADEQAFGEQRGNARAFAHAAIDAGADLVLGSGPHVLRGIEIYDDRLIAYSLGNLAGWKNFSVAGASATSALLRVRIGKAGAFRGGTLTPLHLAGAGVPQRDPTRAAVTAIRDLSTADFGARAPHISVVGRLTRGER
ncbi:MAG: CapA family protein, partial [Conexibacter sp.]|nr:CapA family protein [Conexibacter sp.]